MNQKNEKEKMIDDILRYFNIDSPNKVKPTNPWGNYISKINMLFKNRISTLRMIEINSQHWKIAGIPNQREYIRGTGQTIHYLIDGLYFFGFIKSRRYNENMLLEGIELPEIIHNQDFDAYLASATTKSNIYNNFEKDIEWFQKRICSAVSMYLTKNNIRDKKYSSILAIYNEQYDSKFRGIIDKISLLMSNDNYVKIPQGIKEKIKQTYTSKGIEELELDKDFINLRSKFREKLKAIVEKTYNGLRNENELLIDYKKCEAAHIIPVYKLIEENEMDDIINPDNGIFIDPNMHTMYDASDTKVIFKNETGEFIDKDNNVIGVIKINSKERIDFLNKRNDWIKEQK